MLEANLRRIYDEIKRNSVGSSVLIFVPSDCDALCALCILTDLLQADLIVYTLKPITGKQDILDANEEMLEGRTDIRSVVFLNCGGRLRLDAYLSLPDDRKVYVIDSQRPYHLLNVRHSQIVLVSTAGEDLVDIDPFMEADVQQLQDPESDDEEDDSDSDSDTDGDDDDEEEDPPEDEDEDPEERRMFLESKRKRQEERQQRKAKRQKRSLKQQQREYYHSSFYRTGAANILYSVAATLNRKRRDLLWFAIVGTTAQLVEHRITYSLYSRLVEYFVDIVDLNDVGKQTLKAGDIDVPAPDDNRISVQKECRFMLLRHWSLYQSMYHSSYVASELALWKQQGQSNLDKCLALMGIPLEEANQKYKNMRVDFQSSLIERVTKYANTTGLLGEVLMTTFQRQHGYRFDTSASDIVHSVSALLDSSVHDNTSSVSSADKWESRFYAAYDALQCQQADVLQKGVEASIRIQAAVVKQGMAIIERSEVLRLPAFCYALLEVPDDVHLFSHPLVLSSLAHFVMNAATSSRTKKKKPMLLAGRCLSDDNFLVVGVATPRDDNTKSSFAYYFQRAVDDITPPTQANPHPQDHLQALVATIPRTQIASFFDTLTVLTDEGRGLPTGDPRR